MKIVDYTLRRAVSKMAELNPETIIQLLKQQKSIINGGKTGSLEFRLQQLQALKRSVQQHEREIIQALHQDLRKPEFEAYSTEIGYLYDSIGYVMKNLHKWMKPDRVRNPLVHFGSRSYIYSEPYGSTLIIGPFNYPFMLVMDPLVGAIAAGNCAVIKPSEYTPHVSAVISKLISECFDESYVRVIQGGQETTSTLLQAPFDMVFFTGSVRVGKIVMKAAADHLTPVVLELGGKSPCIVDKNVNLDVAAQRIVWGKYLNTGQTCVAPDYVLVHKDVRAPLIAKMKEYIISFYGTDPQLSPDYGRIVNHAHWERLNGLLEGAVVVAGGQTDREDLYIAPTLLDGVNWSDKVMEDEIFGPILPVLEYHNLDQVIEAVNSRPKPLALYLFTNDKQIEQRIMSTVSFGGGCVNDTIMHLVSPYLPFGGVGSSGMGAYHGRQSFDAFSHKKSVLNRPTRINPNFLFPPYNDKKLGLVKRFLK
ncbi:aldehyde dehydrogenase [Paenibacillus motobuensis]|uniref:aldehyde dehydrogenase n=1 Tax=Paenibacillus TaxID=44249 RepID=UPI00203ED784|nr:MULTISPECIES: aldehyde dehydrogenase [Paenibacillus]MCM3041642.1 aldehyde dehydrogenase [Paenibacillus lutimineralis]MCM3648746.1 aldehyde dehydrogenase [Paenibacillus motobuensis]